MNSRFSQIPCENGKNQKKDYTDIEWKENSGNLHIILAVAKLLVVANAQDDIELFSSFCFLQSFNSIDVEPILCHHIQAFYAEDYFAQKSIWSLASSVFELNEEACHYDAEEDQEKNWFMF